MMNYYFGYMGLFGGFSMLIFWGAFIWFIVWLIKQNQHQEKERDTKTRPIDIAKERYAKGEITKKEF